MFKCLHGVNVIIKGNLVTAIKTGSYNLGVYSGGPHARPHAKQVQFLIITFITNIYRNGFFQKFRKSCMAPLGQGVPRGFSNIKVIFNISVLFLL
jgi:hypothetical protein